MRQDNANIRKVMQLARELLILADEGQAAARDDGCRLLFGVVQDCAYKIRLEAERSAQRISEVANGNGTRGESWPRPCGMYE